MELKIRRPKGTNDIVPSEIHKWHYVENMLKEISEKFGFSEIRFPVFEHTELFIRGVGETTDVVNKEMYTFLDKGNRSISLRPEGTASVVRAYLENSLYALGSPFKVYYIVPNFRYEKPQSGRLREHHQFGVECFGSSEPSADAEVISLADTFLRRLNVKNVKARINSIGCPGCRPTYYEALRKYFEEKKDILCPTCLERLEKNPMRILDCKNPECAGAAENAPKALEYLCGECSEHFDKVKKYLDEMGIAYEVDPGIVRGLDYYTKTVFEFVSGDIGAQGTVLGGGRYDGLVESLGGQKTPGLGFGCGLERLIMVMESSGAGFGKSEAADVFIASIGEGPDIKAQKLVYELRLLGIAAERDLCARSVKAQMKNADRLKTRFSIVLGQDELNSSRIVIRDMYGKREFDSSLSAEAIAEVLRANRQQ